MESCVSVHHACVCMDRATYNCSAASVQDQNGIMLIDLSVSSVMQEAAQGTRLTAKETLRDPTDLFRIIWFSNRQKAAAASGSCTRSALGIPAHSAADITAWFICADQSLGTEIQQ